MKVAANPVEEMLLVSEMMRRHADAVNPSLLVDVQRYYPKAWAVFLEHKENRILKDITDSLKRGIEQKFYRTDIDLETMARLRVELIQLGFDDRVFPHTKDVMVLQDQLLHHFVRGILTDAGFVAYNHSVEKLKKSAI